MRILRITLLVFITIALYVVRSHAAPVCASLFGGNKSNVKQGYLPRVAQMDLTGDHVIKDFEGYVRDNLGDSFVDSARDRAAFVVIAIGNGPTALAHARQAGFVLGEKIEKREGFHQIRAAKNSRGENGFVIYRVNGPDREIHIQSFLRWLELPSSKILTVGENHNWVPELRTFFYKLGPPPDLVVYGFSESAFHGLLAKNPVSNAFQIWGVLKGLKERGKALDDSDADLTGRPVYIVTLASGQRIWFFKNMYGSLARDLLEALSSYGAKNFLVLGTGGSMSPETLPFGSVYTPSKNLESNGKFSPFQVFRPLAGVPVVGNYTRADTNNDQTQAWVQNAISRGITTVDMETGYVAQWAKSNRQVKVSLAMVISETMVGKDRIDMTEWGPKDLLPLQKRFADFIKESIGAGSNRDLRVQNFTRKLFGVDR